MTILDFVNFEKELYKASIQTIDAIWKDSQNENLYCFALVTTGLFGYIFPNANTEEFLQEQAKQYILETQDFNRQIEMAMKYFRWEPTAYWRFFKKHYAPFEKVNKILEESNIQDSLCKLSDIEFDKTTAKIEDIMFDVLNKLREDGYFGKNQENFYTNICYQDQSFKDLYRCALRVNSSEICNSMWNDLSDVINFWSSKRQNAG
jgi:hypothetical protein